MHVRYGVASVSIPGFPEQKFRTDLPRVFPGIRPAAIDRLCDLARCAAGQKHGCMLVISGKAPDEAGRLAAQCTRVEPFRLEDSVIPLVTAIDGSVLIDTEANCHAIGVILDGMASPKCSPERGSRYNSAVRYVLGRSDAMAVVKSEDGMISVFPDLRPQVRRSDIRRRLADLKDVADKVPIDIDALRELIGWLEQHEFYLTAAECVEANRFHQEAQSRIPPGSMYPVRMKPITPDPDMNDSYYLPE